MTDIRNLLLYGMILSVQVACKTKEERAAADLQNAREKTTEQRQDLANQREKVTNAQDDEAKARKRFIDTMDERLRSLDERIAKAKNDPNPTVDNARLTQLRDEASALRNRVADSTQAWSEDFRTTFNRITRDLEEQLEKK